VEQLDDTYLMKKVQAGDLSQMGILFKRHHRDLYGYFFRMTNQQTKSEDLVQTVFYRLMKYRHTYRGEVKFNHWMYTIAKNVWRDTFRKKDPLHQVKEVSALNHHQSQEKGIVEQLAEKDRVNLLRKALLQLTPEKREAIILSRYQGLKYQEIAQLSDCSENAIKSRVQRGLMELKTIIKKIETEITN